MTLLVSPREIFARPVLSTSSYDQSPLSSIEEEEVKRNEKGFAFVIARLLFRRARICIVRAGAKRSFSPEAIRRPKRERTGAETYGGRQKGRQGGSL
jgi:hypothetical protein